MPTLASREKKCFGCDQLIALEGFGRLAKSKDGRRSRCRECCSEYARAYYANREGYSFKQREYHFVKKYGITIAERDALIANQGGKCAICGATRSEGQWGVLTVDHDHRTNNVRGMLCDHCNRGLGHFRDNPDLLLAAMTYLLQTVDVLASTEEAS